MGDTKSVKQAPLLTGELAARTRASLAEIGAALLARAPRAIGDVSLASGAAGLALFHAAYAQSGGSDAHAERALALSESLVGALEDDARSIGPELFGGTSGVGTVLHEICQLDGDFLAPLDDSLLVATAKGPFALGYDMISGLAGIGLYAIRRRESDGGKQMLGQVVERLLELSTATPDGIAWPWDHAWTPAQFRKRAARAYIDVGVAHGVGGILPVLAAACAILPDAVVARSAYDGARNWLLSQQMGLASSTYPDIVAPREPIRPGRHAWCYGDVGLAGVLHAAAQWADDAPLADHARRVAERALGLPFVDAGFRDAGLCHGTAGVAHLYHRLFRATGTAAFADYAARLFDATLEMRRPGEGVAGYAPHRSEACAVDESDGFLEGAAGIGLAQLAALGEAGTSWDDVLGLLPSPGPTSSRWRGDAETRPGRSGPEMDTDLAAY
jgi:hypothetical protein